MWVLTERGELVNLAHRGRIDYFAHSVLSHFPNDDGHEVLCFCDDSEHGKAIVDRLANAIANGRPLIEICDVKASDRWRCESCGKPVESDEEFCDECVRVAAIGNSCGGIATKALENGALRELVDAASDSQDSR